MLARQLTVLAVALILLATPAIADSKLNREVSDFLSHRNVLLSIEFSPGSHILSVAAREAIDRVAPDLLDLMDNSKVVRIEGYASPSGPRESNLVLSMKRAMAVQVYLMDKYGVDIDLFFNGFGEEGNIPTESKVQLAFYDDSLGLKAAEVETIITE
jgi:outer membrane protein OmpA-like peptidoglycan-associated protein